MNIADREYKPNGEIPAGKSLPSGIFRVAMCVEYDGSAYSGWQRQNHSRSVQETLEKVLSNVADEPIQVVCAGRTDTGVHASSQIVHFDTHAQRLEHQWVFGLNTGLPNSVAVTWAKQVVPQFHARFSAKSRSYRYVICNKSYKPAILNAGLTWFRRQLDASKMSRASGFLLGKHDFSSFRAAGCSAHTPVREVQSVSVRRIGDFVVLDITANAFLQHMVRNIAGVLLEIGSSGLPVSHMREILECRDRTKSAATASPKGLYLVDVEYPSHFGLPPAAKGPSFLECMLPDHDR